MLLLRVLFLSLGAYLSYLFISMSALGCGDMASVADSDACFRNSIKMLPWAAHGSLFGLLFFELLNYLRIKFWNKKKTESRPN
jgi:hypothetical protein